MIGCPHPVKTLRGPGRMSPNGSPPAPHECAGPAVSVTSPAICEHPEDGDDAVEGPDGARCVGGW